MKLWISGEIMAEVADAYREARKDVERLFNDNLGDRSYGESVQRIKLIGILMDGDDPKFAEVSKYHKREKDAEFRLKLDYLAFRDGPDLQRRRLVAGAVLRAIKMLPQLSPACDSSRLAADFVEAAEGRAWL